MKRVLVIAPHMDDEVLGCGATLAKHVAMGDIVDVCICCNRAYDRTYDQATNDSERSATLKAKEILGYAGLRFLELQDERVQSEFPILIDGLEAVVQEIRPQVVYVPHVGDLHQDHQAVAHGANISLRAIAAPFVSRVLAYEVPSGTDQVFLGTLPPFLPNVFVEVAGWVEKKIEAMSAYERESRQFPHPRSPEMLRAQLARNGAIIGASAAESFILLRELV